MSKALFSGFSGAKRRVFFCGAAAVLSLFIAAFGVFGNSAVFSLKTGVNPKDAGTVSPSGNAAYNLGAEAVVTAAPGEGYTFIGWSGASSSPDDTVIIMMYSDQALTANFFHPRMLVKGTFTDSRDGKKYRTVKMGKLWMAENLKFKAEGNTWCYGDDESNCQKYGRLYDWDAAVKACPAGWRLPTRDDWNILARIAGETTAGIKLKSKIGWKQDGNGTDDYGFAAQPGGFRQTTGKFGNLGIYGYWWSATEREGGKAYYKYMYYNYDAVYEHYNRGLGISIRCVKD